MKKRVIKRASRTIHRSNHLRKPKMRGMSWVSIVIAIFALSIVLGGLLFVPKPLDTQPNNDFIMLPDKNCTGGSNLHLCSFLIITLTPTPKPPPEFNANQGSNGAAEHHQSSNHNSNQSSDGGHHSPTSNSGSGGGGSGGGSSSGGPPPL